MKKVILIFICLCTITGIYGQIYEREKPSNVTLQHRICFYGRYDLNKDGLYQYKECDDNVVFPTDYYKLSNGNERFFAYDKKYNRYYFYSNNVIGYYSPTKLVDTKEFKMRIIDNEVPVFSLEDIPQIKSIARNILDKVYKEKNDIIIEERRIAERKKREKQINDSIEALKRKSEEREQYRKDHNWHELTLDYATSLYCDFCKETHLERSMYVFSLSSDTIYYLKENPEISLLGKTHRGLHYGKMTESMKQSRGFKNYVDIWRDSIALHNDFSNIEAVNLNLYSYLRFKDEITRMAPNGFVSDWGWNLNSADGVEPYFSYYNTSAKIIKYVDFYFSLFNAVGDKCYLKYNRSYTGHVRGVGPVESFSSGSWEWDRATHYTTSDASEMRIVKIVITYMDKSIKTLTGNNIKYN